MNSIDQSASIQQYWSWKENWCLTFPENKFATCGTSLDTSIVVDGGQDVSE